MKVKSVKRMLSVLLVAAMTLCAVGCGGNTTESEQEAPAVEEQTQETVENVEETSGVTFPLEEEVTFDIMVKYDGDANAYAENVPFFQELYEATNVKINFVSLPSDGAVTNLNALFTAGKEGDAIMNNIISEAEMVTMAESGLIVPLEEYVNDPEIMPNFNERVLAESPATKGAITAADGHIYALPRYNALAGNYLESPMWINKNWLDQLGMEIPDTMEELEAALVAFRDNDMNGNGNTSDEVPLVLLNGNAYWHMESLLGMWGLGTKDNGSDHFYTIQDGKAVYVPTTEGYKDAIKTLNSWYEQGLIWSEIFTGTNESYSAVTQNDGETNLVGLFTGQNPYEAFKDEFVQLLPISADGYEAEWYCNPGILGNKNKFFVTRSCEQPEILMAWIDLFYDFENSIRVFAGEENLGWEYTADGKVTDINYDDAEKNQEKADATLVYAYGDGPGAYTQSDYAERYALNDYMQTRMDNYELYKDYFDDEFWPRPYLTPEASTRLGELRPDISNTVSMYKANWVTGASDIDEEWDAYVESLEVMGIEEYTQIIQDAYDAYVEASK